MPKRLTGRFTAHGDDGRDYVVDVVTASITTPTEDGGGGETVGIQEYYTGEGRAVARLDRGVYKIIDTEVILRSTSPDAS